MAEEPLLPAAVERAACGQMRFVGLLEVEDELLLVRLRIVDEAAQLVQAARRQGQATAKSNGSKKDGTPGQARKKTTAT